MSNGLCSYLMLNVEVCYFCYFLLGQYKNALMFFISIFSSRKLNLLITIQGFIIVFKSIGKKNYKINNKE